MAEGGWPLAGVIVPVAYIAWSLWREHAHYEEAAGFSVEMAAHAYSLLDSYIYLEASDDVGEIAQSMLEARTRTRPHSRNSTRLGYSLAGNGLLI
jgi:hypothetical protein